MCRCGEEGGEKEGEERTVIFGVNILVCACECVHVCIAIPLWNATEGTNAQTPWPTWWACSLATQSHNVICSPLCVRCVCVGVRGVWGVSTRECVWEHKSEFKSLEFHAFSRTTNIGLETHIKVNGTFEAYWSWGVKPNKTWCHTRTLSPRNTTFLPPPPSPLLPNTFLPPPFPLSLPPSSPSSYLPQLPRGTDVLVLVSHLPPAVCCYQQWQMVSHPGGNSEGQQQYKTTKCAAMDLHWRTVQR